MLAEDLRGTLSDPEVRARVERELTPTMRIKRSKIEASVKGRLEGW